MELLSSFYQLSTFSMASKHILSKSTFMYGCQCPKRLFLHKFKSELRNPIDEKQETVFSSGTNIGLLARALFPNGLSAEPPNPFSYHLSVEKTAKFISQNIPVIYEAAFNFEGVMCALDILVKKNSKWYAFEVKGSTKIKTPFILDAALQYYVISNSGLPIEDISIVHLNNQYIRNGKLEIEKLFTCESVLDSALEQSEYISQNISDFKRLIADKTEPEIEVGKHCFKPYECDFTIHCWKDEKAEEKKYEKNIDKINLKEFLNQFQYPLRFFDFETIMPGIPEFDNSRPYQQIPFQYSLHVLNSEKAKPSHIEFLGNGINDPREELIQHLIANIDTIGSIVVWNKSFEVSRLKELARDFPVYADKLYAIIERVVDLMVPFRSGWYRLPAFKDSYSIKAILPVMVPSLSYSKLDIQEGGMASMIYSELKIQTLPVQKNHRLQLLDYCKLDTLAMIKIFQKLKNV